MNDMVVQVVVSPTGNMKVDHKGLNPDQVLMCLNAAMELVRRKLLTAEILEAQQMAQLARMAGPNAKGGLILP